METNDLRKAAEMALETLCVGANDAVPNDIDERFEQAIQALRQALAQPEQEPVGYINGMYGGYMVFTPINPSAVYLNGTALYTTPVDAVNMIQERVDETAKREHEPVCFLRETAWSYEIAPWDDPNGIPVYSAPPKGEWVGLTDDEVIKCFDSVAFGQVEDDLIINKHVNIFRAIHGIEAKLKEKNT